jgi:predicted DNA-binding transcriptional regulator AlpA
MLAAATPMDNAIGVPSPRTAPQSPGGPPALDDDVLLTSAQTRARIGGVSTMCVWRWMRDPRVQFPAPIKIGSSSRNYWRLGDLRRWQAERTRKAAAALGLIPEDTSAAT